MHILKALTMKAQQWIDGNVYCEDYQKVIGGIAGDWRMIDTIHDVMIDKGFKDSRRWWQFWIKVDFQII